MQSVSSLHASPAERLGAPTKHEAFEIVATVANTMAVVTRMLMHRLLIVREPVVHDSFADAGHYRANEQTGAQVHGAAS